MIKGYTFEGNPVAMTMQVAKVTKPLGSVRAMVKANNTVVFDEGGSYVYNKDTGVKTRIHERGGAYVFDIWAPRGEEAVTGNRYQALAQEDQQNDKEVGFAGLDDLM